MHWFEFSTSQFDLSIELIVLERALSQGKTEDPRGLRRAISYRCFLLINGLLTSRSPCERENYACAGQCHHTPSSASGLGEATGDKNALAPLFKAYSVP